MNADKKNGGPGGKSRGRRSYNDQVPVRDEHTLKAWRDQVHADESLHGDNIYKLMLVGLSGPEMMDRENFVVPYRVKWLSEATGIAEQTIRNQPGDWDQTRNERLLASRYVNQIGTCEWDDSRGHTRQSPLLDLVIPKADEP
jgi:hypothetical protein